MRSFFTAALLSVALAACASSSSTAPPEPASIQPQAVIDVWPGVAPGSETWTQQEIAGEFPGAFPNPIVRNVTHPTITAYLPDPAHATGAAVIIAPGGGFMFLSMKSEGSDVAQWLAAHGVAAFVLKYRVRETPADNAAFMAGFRALLGQATSGANRGAAFPDIAPLATADAVQAIALVRARAAEWGIDPRRVGIVGFSAGARVAAGALLQADPAARPSFAAPIYGGMFGERFEVPRDLPPTFIAVSADDPIALQSTLDLADTLRRAGQRPELHMFNAGVHGYGMNRQGFTSDHWIDSFYWWMEANGFLRPRSP